MNTVDSLKKLYKTMAGKDWPYDPNPTDAEVIDKIAADASGSGGSEANRGVIPVTCIQEWDSRYYQYSPNYIIPDDLTYDKLTSDVLIDGATVTLLITNVFEGGDRDGEVMTEEITGYTFLRDNILSENGVDTIVLYKWVPYYSTGNSGYYSCKTFQFRIDADTTTGNLTFNSSGTSSVNLEQHQ